MNVSAKGERPAAILAKADPTSPCIVATGRETLAIRSAITFAGRDIAAGTLISMPNILEPGGDYGVMAGSGGVLGVERLTAMPDAVMLLAGFHFAPGGNAPARAGGDDVPAINPYSVWDINFRPTCPDPRGMAFIPPRNCWADIYLTAADHLANGTSQFGVKIADGDDPPENPAGKRFKTFDYDAACAVVAHHGKSLLSFEDFIAAAYGVSEKPACSDDPEVTGLDAARTSKFGLMQATGNLWQWGHDGDPDKPRASFFGGSWLHGGNAGSPPPHGPVQPAHPSSAGARG